METTVFTFSFPLKGLAILIYFSFAFGFVIAVSNFCVCSVMSLFICIKKLR